MTITLSPRWRRWAAAGVAVAVTAVSVALRLNSPAALHADWTYDDGLFTNLAGHLLDGEWLGPYGLLTLSKGPGYPIFIALVYKAHLPLKLAEHAVHLLAAGVTGAALWKVSRSRLLGLLVYGAIALDPGYLGVWSSGVTRDAFYGSLSLLLVGSTLLFLAWVPDLSRRRAIWAAPVAATCGAALGLSAAAYYVTREERIWLAPALVAAAVAGVATWWRAETRVRQAIAAAALALVTATCGFAWSLHSISSRNEAAYGTSVISDLAEGEIARAYVQWQRIDLGEVAPLVPVNAEQRAAAYRVSPAARELEGFLEGDGSRWMGPGCTPVQPGCEYSGGFFVWAMREGAQVAGHMADGAEAQRFFGRLADEIEAACDDDSLPCTDPGVAAMPPLSRVDTGRFVPAFQAGVSYAFSFDVAEPPGPRVSGGTDDNWAVMIRALRGIDGTQSEYNAMEARAEGRQQVVAALTDVYRWTARLGVFPAVLGLVLAFATRTGRRHWPVAAFGCVMAVGLLSRLGLLTLVHATAFVAARYGTYILPGVDFLVVTVVVGCWLTGTIVADAARRRRASPPGHAGEPDGEGPGRNGQGDAVRAGDGPDTDGRTPGPEAPPVPGGGVPVPRSGAAG